VSARALRRWGAVAGGLVLAVVLSDLLVELGSSRSIPPAVVGQAVVYGCVNALFALGLVLIYRATRVINFAHAGFGAVGAVLSYEIFTLEGWPYAVAVPVGIAVGAAFGFLVELVFVRRFARSARLVLTVVTIGVAQLLAGMQSVVPNIFGDKRRQSTTVITPLTHYALRWFPVTFTGDSLLLVVVTIIVLVGMVMFFKLSSVGIAVRGIAENEDRAALVGVNTKRISTLVWVIAGALSALATVLQVPLTGFSQGSSSSALGLGLLLPALAAAVLGGMDNLPITVAASIGISIFQEGVYFAFSQTAISDAALLVLIVVAFLLQRRKLLRVDEGSISTWAATEEVRPVPAALAGVPSVRTGRRWAIGVLGLVVLLYPWVMTPGQTNAGSLYLIYGIVVISLVILTGWGGQISLGQFAFVGVGAALGGMLTSRLHLPFLLALVAACLGGAGFAVLLGLTALRVRGLYLAVTTLAFAVVTDTVILNPRIDTLLPTTVGRPSVPFVKFEDERAFYYLCLLALIAVVMAGVGMRKSRTGRVLIALRENELGAQALGINLVRTRLVTFAISGSMAAFAGVLFAAHEHAVAQNAFGPDQSVQMFLTAVIGGLGSIPSALLGAVYFAILNIAFTSGVVHFFASGIGVLVMLYFFPRGLGGLVYQARDAILRRVAIRNRIYVPSLLSQFGMGSGEFARIPMVPRAGPDGGQPEPLPRYRLPSRIGVAGASQSTRRWSL